MTRAGSLRPVAPRRLDRLRNAVLILAPVLLVLAPTLLLVGCATPPRGQRDLLDFVVDGQTTCAQVQDRLGPADTMMEFGRILAYGIGVDKTGYTLGAADSSAFYAGYGIWSGLKYSFVVICDPEGRVERHSLVAVKANPDETNHGSGQ